VALITALASCVREPVLELRREAADDLDAGDHAQGLPLIRDAEALEDLGDVNPLEPPADGSRRAIDFASS